MTHLEPVSSCTGALQLRDAYTSSCSATWCRHLFLHVCTAATRHLLLFLRSYVTQTPLLAQLCDVDTFLHMCTAATWHLLLFLRSYVMQRPLLAQLCDIDTSSCTCALQLRDTYSSSCAATWRRHLFLLSYVMQTPLLARVHWATWRRHPLTHFFYLSICITILLAQAQCSWVTQTPPYTLILPK